MSFEQFESRDLMAGMQIGMNLDNVRDYLPNWMFNDVFQSSRPWISHSYNTVTSQFDFNGGAIPVTVDAEGWPTQLQTWTNANGQLMQQRLGTLMFNSLDGEFPGGVYRAEWDGTGDVVFGMNAGETARGTTPDGRHFALLNVVPGNGGIYLGINSMSPSDPIRDVHVWMPDYNGQSFADERWQPGESPSPFHPLFKERLDDFGILRFMQTQETNTTDIRTWSDRRDTNDARQNSGMRGPMANGISVEHMVQLANELDADPWFNMPHMADDIFVQNFATYVRDNLEPGRTAYVEWSNEVWNTAAGFEAAPWIAEQVRLPENSGLTTWQFVGREMRRDMEIWTSVFAGQTSRIVRTVGGQAANSWVAERILENMGGSFDAIAIAPYYGPSAAQRASYSAATTVEQILGDLQGNLPYSTQTTLNHQRLADDYGRLLNRDIRLLAYEGGPALDGRNALYQNAFHQATKDPRMAGVMRDYLRQQHAAGLDAYVHYKLSDADRVTQYGMFGVLTAQDQPTSEAHVYRTLLEAASGSLLTIGPTLVTASAADTTAHEAGRGTAAFRVTRGGNLAQPLTVGYSLGGAAAAGTDYVALPGAVTFPANQSTVYIVLNPLDDLTIEGLETAILTLNAGANYSLIGGTTSTATISIVSNDLVAGAPTVSIAATDALASETNRDPAVFTITRSNGNLNRPLTMWLQNGQQTAAAGDYDAVSLRVDFAAGQTAATISIRPVDDAIVENRETVILMLDPNSANFRVGNRSATVNILDNDSPAPALPTVSIVATDASAAEAGRESGTISVSRTGATASPLTVNYAVLGTATNGFDYDRLAGTVTIPAGAASAAISILPIDENVADGNETVLLRLNSNAAYLGGGSAEAAITIADNDSANGEPLPVLMVIANGDFYFQEYSDPRRELEAAGVPVVVAAGRRELSVPHANTGYGAGNGAVMPDLALADANASDYSVILFVGGWGATQYQFAFPGVYSNALYNGSDAIRASVNELINDFVAQDKFVTGVCHGVSVLSWSRVDGQSPMLGRVATTAHFNSPANNIPGATLYRWHSEVNGATVYTGGVLGNAAIRHDDVVVDGRFITAENFDSAALFGRTVAAYVRSGSSAAMVSVVSLDSIAAEENVDPASLIVSRSGVLNHALVIRYQTSGAAENGVDYAALGGRLLFQPGQSQAVIIVTPIDDANDEANKDLFFALLDDPAYDLGLLSSSLLTILDND